MTPAGSQHQETSPLPLLSVVISTRGRPSEVSATVGKILSLGGCEFELVVVDQNDGDEATTLLEPFRIDRRFRLLRCHSRGVSTGRNMAIRECRSEFIFITDDDCEVAPDTFAAAMAALSSDDRIGVVFGNVFSVNHDPAAGAVPAYVRQDPFLARGMKDKDRVEGLSACMAIRKSVWRACGGFDELLGAGAPLESGAETDFTIRCLQAGYWVLETPAVRVVHNGFRTAPEVTKLARRYWFGTGAVYGKHLRCGNLDVTRSLWKLGGRFLFGGNSAVGASLGAHASRTARLASFGRGFLTGIMTPVRRDQCLFRTPIP